MNTKEQIKLRYDIQKGKHAIINANCKKTCGRDKYPTCGNLMCRAYMLCQELERIRKGVCEGKTHVVGNGGKMITCP